LLLPQLLAQAIQLAVQIGELGVALAGQHQRFGEARIQLGLLGEHPRQLVVFVGNRGLGGSQLGFGEGQLVHLLDGANGLGLGHGLFGQAYLFGGDRIGGATGEQHACDAGGE